MTVAATLVMVAISVVECGGHHSDTSAGISPPLRFSGVPPAAAALALIVTDPDAPRGTYTHWVVFNLPPHVHEVASASTPPQARHATNSAGTIGYHATVPAQRR